MEMRPMKQNCLTNEANPLRCLSYLTNQETNPLKFLSYLDEPGRILYGVFRTFTTQETNPLLFLS